MTPEKIFVNTPNGERDFRADLIVLAAGSRPVNQLAETAEGLVEDVYVIGDSLSPV